MSLDTTFVETPKDDASFGELEAIRSKAAASVHTAAEIAGEAMAEVSKAAGVAEEGKKADADSKASAGKTAEGEVASEIAMNTLTPGLQVAAAGIEMFSDKKTDPLSKVDTQKIGKQTGGIVGRQATSFEDGFSKMKKASTTTGNMDAIVRKIDSPKKGRGLFEKAKNTEESLKGQEGLTASWKKMEESSQVMQHTRELALGNRMANEQVYARAINLQAKAAPKQPGPAGMTHDAMKNGPKFKAPTEETGDSGESWMGA